MTISISQGGALPKLLASALCASAFGAAACLGHGLPQVLRGAWMAPALFVGGALLAAPPLYLMTSIAGGKLTAGDVLRNSVDALSRVSMVLLGLAAPAAFFSVTLGTWVAPALLLAVVGLMGAAGVLTVLTQALRTETEDRVRLAGLAWTGFAMLVGARLMGAIAAAAGGWGAL